MSREGPWVGREIRTYKILSLLGRGGMGEVYRARDARLGRDVAIKVLHPSFAGDSMRRGRFEHEARALAALNHPNIAAIYGVEDVTDGCALILELVEGPTLAESLRARPLPVASVIHIGRQICEAIEAAHDKGIVHRDLKPANIKVAADGTVKVLDFGLAKALGADSPDVSQAPTVTSEGGIVGTPAYMSPEQARGQTTDRRTDVWAFGCILFEMLTGRSAFAANTSSDTIAAVLASEPKWDLVPKDVPAYLRRLLRRCLQKDLKQRLHDIGDARIELEDAVSESGSAEVMPGAAASGRFHWVGVGVFLLLLLAAVATLVGIFRPASSADAGPRLSRPLRITNSAALEFGPAISPDGKWVAYYSNERGPTDVWVKFLETGATSNLTSSLNLELPTKVALGGLAISPDGGLIAFAARTDPQFQTFDTYVIPAPIGGTPRKMLQVLQGMQWSPDGKQIIAMRPGSSRGDALVLANSDGTNQRDLITPEGGRHVHWPAWSADGKYVYFNYTYDGWQDEPSHIYRIPATGGTPEPVVRSVRRAIFPIPFPGGGLAFSGNPDTVDLGLRWQRPGETTSRPLTTGIGEYAEARLSADGRKLVATRFEPRQSLVLLPLGGALSAIHQMTDEYSGDLDPVMSPTGDRLAFSSIRLGHRNLWISRPDGTQPAPLTTENDIDHRPAFSPDGQQIAFISDRGGQTGIWIISTEGGAPKLIATTEVAGSLTWSRDGKRILFTLPGGDLPRLATVSIADDKIDTFPAPTAAVAPQWSPTADVIAYLEPATVPGATPSSPPVARSWLTFIDPQGRRLFENLPKHQFANGLLAWSPDGKRLAAIAVAAYGPASVWIVEPDGQEPFKKVADLPAKVYLPKGITWTPDGKSLIIGQMEAITDIVLFDVNR